MKEKNYSPHVAQLFERITGQKIERAVVQKMTDEEVEKRRQYFEKVRNGTKSDLPPPLPFQKIDVDFEAELNRFRDIFRRFQNMESQIRPGYSVKYSTDQAGQIPDLIRWVLNHEGKLDKGKGIFLYGPPGCGKTKLAEMLYEFAITAHWYSEEKKHLYKAYKPINVTVEIETAKTEKEYDIIRTLCVSNIGFDEMFFKPGMDKISHYGNEVNAYGALIYRMEKIGKINIITSNCTPDELNMFLQPPEISRLLKMYNIVRFVGPDNRIF